ncbi:hypothetical protein L228DRAFT_281790 [Xylona heveae TC161]|uniref:STE24 endopeptidase n=1 Tax=Xylona heveae (strain CBS 132557 / TC161) TaxID=1328760 RepID=A0A161TFE7_XYLHT|nr:hypothetical protein L228DRAFT_281790 [Xylona heveae TC161]KZF24747.1 hypothetical protein L228DRAFT_281790 [Xylona heveae TC161]
MPTQLDRALQSKGLFVAFTGLVTAVAAWSIWGSDIFPAESDPKGNPEDWTTTELRRWLEARKLHPDARATREELIERVKANMRTPPRP